MRRSNDDVVMDTDDLVEAYLTHLRRQHFTPDTIRGRRYAIYRYAKLHGLDPIDGDAIDQYVWRDDLSEWTRHTYWQALHGLCEWAAKEGKIEYDPTVGIIPPPSGQAIPQPLHPTEITHALEQATDPWTTAIILAVGAGLRASEIADLRREDVTVRSIHVRRGKGGKARWVHTTRMVWEHVRDKPPGHLVRSPVTGNPVTGAWLSSRQRKFWVGVGLPHAHLHCLRATFATTMVDGGVPESAVAAQLGHVGLDAIKHYVQVTESMRKRAVDAIDQALGESPAGPNPAGNSRPLT